MSLERAIYAAVKAHAGLTALIGSGDNTRLYPFEAAHSAAFPHITFRVVSHQPAEAMSGVSDLRARRVEFQIHSKAAGVMAELSTVSAQLRDCFERYSGTLAGDGWTHTIDQALLDNETDLGLDINPKTYRRALDFIFWSTT